MTAAVLWTLGGGMVARKLVMNPRDVRLVLAGVVGGAVAGVGLLALGMDSNSDTFPIYGSVRLFGAHQFAGCACVLALLVHPGGSRITRVITFAAALMVWSGVFWSGSRAPMIALGLFILLWLWRGTPEERRSLLRVLPLLIGGGLAISFLLGRPYAGMGWFSAVERTLQATSVEQVSSDRSLFWAETWRYALSSPWIGHGADGYRYITPTQNGSQPHNVLLQWLIEYGVFGLVPLTMLLVRGLRTLFIAQPSASVASGLKKWAPSALAGTAAYGLLEGVFYHATIFMPAAVIAGLAIGMHPSNSSTHRAIPVVQVILRPLMLLAALILVLHGWLVFMLLRAPEVTPDSPAAQVLRVFPSTTTGIQSWIDRWRPTQPHVAMEWLKWAQAVSIESASLHVHAAQIYIWEKNYKAAEVELLHCLSKVHHLERPDVQHALSVVRALDTGQPIPPPSP
jgi:hypothetical protein